jgi:dTDP-4-dehydrorhamnose reductase
MNILVTGGSGLLGKGLFETRKQGVFLQSVHLHNYQLSRNMGDHCPLDIRSKKCVDQLFDRHKFEVVIHAAGIASVDYVKNNYAESLESNIVGTLNISSACRKSGAYLIYISSNAVFDGLSAPYAETSTPNPINEYGEIKLECERLIEKTLHNACIIRPILMYGWNHPTGRSNPVTWVLEKLRSGQKINMVDDVWENPLYNRTCGEALWRAIEMRPSGKVHLAGADVLNRFELAKMTAEVFGLDAGLISAVKSTSFPNLAKRPPNTTFSTNKMQELLGVQPESIRAGLEDMKMREGEK